MARPAFSMPAPHASLTEPVGQAAGGARVADTLPPAALLSVPALARPVPPSLRVALFSGNYNMVRDGANKALNQLVRHLIERGVPVRVYSPVGRRPAFQPEGDLVGVPSVPIPGRAEYRFAPGLGRAVRADLERFAPTLVHLSAPDGLGVAAAGWARRRRLPTVASLHTRFETYFSYYGLGFLRPLAEAWLDRFYGGVNRVLAPNALIADELSAGGLAGRVGVWSRGVERSIFAPHRRDSAWRRQCGYSEHEPVVLFFGRLVREKGTDRFAAVVEELRRRGHQVCPLVVGDGPERPAFERALGAAHFTGHLDGPRLGRAIASADILVNPSLTEAFGNVVLEGMAAGLAVVSADVASARALVEPGVSGLLVEPERTAAYADAVEQLMQDPGRRRRLAGAAMRSAGQYEWPQVCDGVIEEYRALLGNGAGLLGGDLGGFTGSSDALP